MAKNNLRKAKLRRLKAMSSLEAKLRRLKTIAPFLFVASKDKRTRRPSFVVLMSLLMLLLGSLKADVKSLSGRIGFDVLQAAGTEMVLNTKGLGIGVQDPVEALEVSGCVMVSRSLSLGGVNASGSNLHLNGSLSLMPHVISGNATLGDHSMVLVNTSSQGNIDLILSANALALHRVLDVKKIHADHEVHIYGVVDRGDRITLGAGYPQVRLICGKVGEWYILSASDGLSSEHLMSSNLLAHWPLDESSGSQVGDQSGFGYHGSLEGGLDLATSSVSVGEGSKRSLNFDGVDDAVVTTLPASVGQNEVLSVSAWFQSTDTSTRMGLLGYTKPNGSINQFFNLRFNAVGAGKITAILRKGGSEQMTYSSEDLSSIWADGNVHHLVVQLDRKERKVRLWLDGQERSMNKNSASANIAGFNFNGLAQFRIGSNDGFAGVTTHPFHGNIDEVRLYNKAVSSPEAHALYLLGP